MMRVVLIFLVILLVAINNDARAYSQRQPLEHGCITKSELENKKCTPCYITVRTILIRLERAALQDEWELKKSFLGQLNEMRKITLVQPDVESQKAIDQLIFKHLKRLLWINYWWANSEGFIPFNVDFAALLKDDFEINPLMISDDYQEELNRFYGENGL
jgi:hypothetical protein